jgi:D-alanine-D-alanine ligase
MHKPRVGVLRGGPSSEFEVSLKTGDTVIKHIPESHYEVQDIFISKDGTWHKNGVVITPHNALSHVDVVFNALHGQYGEDGKVQHLLEMHKVPFTGSGSFASALGMNKAMAKEVFKKNKIKTPQYRLIELAEKESPETLQEKIMSVFRAFPLPLVVKPVSAGSSVGVTLVKSFGAFEPAIEAAFEHSDAVIIEEFIPGVEATVGVIDGYRGVPFYALPPIEIRPHKAKGKAFYDFEAKYQDASDIIVPSNFTKEEKQELEDLARKTHESLGLRHYSRTDFIVSPRRGIYVLEVNTLPGLTEASLVPKALEAVGAPLSHFLDHILQLAIERK